MKKMLIIVTLAFGISSQAFGFNLEKIWNFFPNIFSTEISKEKEKTNSDYDVLDAVNSKIDTDVMDNYTMSVQNKEFQQKKFSTKKRSPIMYFLMQCGIGGIAEYYALPKKYYVSAAGGLGLLRTLTAGKIIPTALIGALGVGLGKGAVWAIKKCVLKK